MIKQDYQTLQISEKAYYSEGSTLNDFDPSGHRDLQNFSCFDNKVHIETVVHNNNDPKVIQSEQTQLSDFEYATLTNVNFSASSISPQTAPDRNLTHFNELHNHTILQDNLSCKFSHSIV
jgi:hypothetical protein